MLHVEIFRCLLSIDYTEPRLLLEWEAKYSSNNGVNLQEGNFLK